jgi:hypothetical protein
MRKTHTNARSEGTQPLGDSDRCEEGSTALGTRTQRLTDEARVCTGEARGYARVYEPERRRDARRGDARRCEATLGETGLVRPKMRARLWEMERKL